MWGSAVSVFSSAPARRALGTARNLSSIAASLLKSAYPNEAVGTACGAGGVAFGTLAKVKRKRTDNLRMNIQEACVVTDAEEH